MATQPAKDQGETDRSAALVRGNLRLVTLIGRHFNNRGLDPSDLIQEGSIGLIKAARRFDETRGVRFSTYAAWWIRQGMSRALAEQGRTIRLPTHVTGTLREIAQTSHDLVRRLGRTPASTEIAERLASTPERIERLLDLRTPLVSLDAPMARHDDHVALIDLVADEGIRRSPEEAMQEKTLARALRRAIAGLRTREREVLSMRFGLDAAPSNLQEVSQRLGLQVHQVRRIEQRALKRLRHDVTLADLRA
jgi:RNA polymerase primary sigma factor